MIAQGAETYNTICDKSFDSDIVHISVLISTYPTPIIINKDNMSDYTGNNNKSDLSDSSYYYKGQQDDDDFEKLIIIKNIWET